MSSMNTQPPSRWFQARPWFLLASFALLIDQLSKKLVASWLALDTSVSVTSFFNLVHVRNPGAAFSFLAEAGGWQRQFLSLLGIAISAWLASEIWRGRARGLERPGYALVIGGAVGNVFDRIWQGAVTDFLDFYWAGLHWPAFNLADVAINAGVVLLVVSALRMSRMPRKEIAT